MVIVRKEPQIDPSMKYSNNNTPHKHYRGYCFIHQIGIHTTINYILTSHTFTILKATPILFSFTTHFV